MTRGLGCARAGGSATGLASVPRTACRGVSCRYRQSRTLAVPTCRLSGHDLLNQPAERFDPALGLAAADHPATPHIPRGEVGQRAVALVGVLDPLTARHPRLRRPRGSDPSARLERGFSSAETTRSPGCKSSPFQRPWYRSRIRPALVANSGSVGKIHERYCHGRIASSCSHRTIVETDASVIPRSITRRWTSATDRRDSGAPLAGGSHATALTSAICSGGETTRSTRPRLICQPNQPMVRESSPPLTDDLRAHLKPGRDLGVRQAIGGVEHQLRALHIPVGQRQLRRPPLKHRALLLTERDLHRRRHHHQIRRPRYDSFIPTGGDLRSSALRERPRQLILLRG